MPGCAFASIPSVLIPRSPVAELIATRCEPWIDGREPRRILDLCCGSGCIGIAAALAWPDAEVVLSDISPAALALARENVALHGVGERVRVVESDLFAALGGEIFDLILSNPPYVDAADMDALPAEFRHEPRLGLAAGEDGLDIARRILAEAPAHLVPEGLLVLEVGNSADALEQAFPQLPFLWPDFEHGGHGIALIHARGDPRAPPRAVTIARRGAGRAAAILRIIAPCFTGARAFPCQATASDVSSR